MSARSIAVARPGTAVRLAALVAALLVACAPLGSSQPTALGSTAAATPTLTLAPSTPLASAPPASAEPSSEAPPPSPTAAPTDPPTPAPRPPTPAPTPVPTVAPPIASFACTIFIGYSQTNNWWWFGGFESVTNNDRYEILFNFGGAIHYWADPGYAGWSNGVSSGCRPSASPDRIVLDVTEDFFISTSDPSQNVAQVARDIRAAIATARAKYPSARQVWLQPVVGGPGGSVCAFNGRTSDPVRASWNHPFIDQAINQVVGGTIVRGPSPTVRTCADYEDNIGHLTDAKFAIGQTIGAWYNAH